MTRLAGERLIHDSRLVPLTGRTVGLVALWTVNVIGLSIVAAAFLLADIGVDWAVYVEAGRRVFDTDLYHWTGILVWRYSPVAAWGFAALTPIGYLGWTALHFGALALLPRKVGLLALVSFPFWDDVYNGNTVTFVFVAAVLALRGNRWAGIAFLALCLLIPRPFMIPIALYLLWQDRGLWLPFAGIFVAHALAVMWSGWGPEWAAMLLTTSQSEVYGNFGPTRIFGAWWLLIGVPLAVWLTVHHRPGLAGLAMSPYILAPYYLMGCDWSEAYPAVREHLNRNSCRYGPLLPPVTLKR
jgi:hypothetical protein